MFGLPIDALTMDQVIGRCASAHRTGRRVLIGVVNAAKIVAAQRDSELRDSLLECDIIVADGQSVVWASKALGKPLPERVAGIDLFSHLLTMADEQGMSIYLLGAKPEVLATLMERIRDDFPGLLVAGARDGYFTTDESEEVAVAIRDSRADMLFLGMTSPKKEIFLRDWGNRLSVPILHGVGGSFDVFAGVTKRAPEAWQRLGMEWLYRLLQEPRRLWRRYLKTNSAFIRMTLAEKRHPLPLYVGSASASAR